MQSHTTAKNTTKNYQQLQDLYQQQLHQLLTAERKYLKLFSKLAASVVTRELKTALSPDKTELPQHIERLKECLAFFKPSKASDAIDQADLYLLNAAAQACKKTKTPPLLKEINALRCSQQIFMLKVTAYQNLQQMAEVLEQSLAAELLEQSAKDNQNNYGHLVQLAGNIIYPDAACLTSSM